jgi:hypothetical protein
MTMHHFESMPSLHIPASNDPFPTSPPASPLSFTSIPSMPEKKSRHTHRRSLAISSHLALPMPSAFDPSPAMITPPLSSPALSFPPSLESLRSGPLMLDYDSDFPRTPTVDGDSLRAIPSLDTLPPTFEGNEDMILPDAESDMQTDLREDSPGAGQPLKLRKVAFNDAVIYYPPRPLSSRRTSWSSQISMPSSRETTPSLPSPTSSHRRSLSSFLLPSPTFLPSASSQHHSRDRKSWTGLITSPFTAARRRRSPNRYRPPTPPLGHEERCNMWQPPTPIIDLDAALGPFQTPPGPLSPSHSAEFWSVTSHVGSHRRSESAPEIRGLGLDTSLSNESIACSRGLKRKMSVIDEEDRQTRTEEMEIDSELNRIILQEGAEMGEMGDLVVDPALRDMGEHKLSKRRSWRKSLREWWKKV